MPHPSAYKSLELFNLSKKLVVSCYDLTHNLPEEESANLTRYIRTAALTCHVNVAQGVFIKKWKNRDRFIEKAQNALVVIDAALEVLLEVKLAAEDQCREVLELSSVVYQSLDILKKDK